MAEILTILFALCGLGILARRTYIPEPIVFLLGGVALGQFAIFRDFTIPPELILPIFLPPLLMEAAYYTSLRDLRANWRPVLLLAFGLVLVTPFAVGYVSEYFIPDMSLAAAIVLGAIISPPDAVAAISILRRVHVPKKIVQIVEGETLLNDATGLVFYQLAVVALITGHFSLGIATRNFFWMITGGPVIGLALGFLFIKAFPLIKERSIEIITTFLVPYLAYFVAESIHTSGVFAVVVTGLTIGWYAPNVFKPSFRIPYEAVWHMAVYILNAIAFVLIGLHMPEVIGRLTQYTDLELVYYAAIVCIVAVAIRFAYVFIAIYGLRLISKRLRERDPIPAWQNVFVIAWTGMRGVVSLATALALPITLSGGVEFKERDLVMFLTFSVILFTVVVQGLSLRVILRRLRMQFNPQLLYEEWEARHTAISAALYKINELEQQGTDHQAALDRMKSFYEDRLFYLGEGPTTQLSDLQTEEYRMSSHPLLLTEYNLWQSVLTAERNAILQLRQNFKVGDDVLHEVYRDLDLMANRFKRRRPREKA